MAGTSMTEVFKDSRKKQEANIEASKQAVIGNNRTELHQPVTGRPRTDKTAKMTIVMTPELKQEIKVYCATHQTTVADIFEEVFRSLLRKND